MKKLLKISWINYSLSFLILLATCILCFFIFLYKIESTLKCMVKTTNYQTFLKVNSKYFFRFKENNKIILKIGNEKFSTIIKKIQPQIENNMITFSIKNKISILKPNLLLEATIIYKEQSILQKLISD